MLAERGVLASLLAANSAPTETELIVSVCHRDKKVNFEKPEVIDALYEIGCPVGDPAWWGDAIDIFNGVLDDAQMEEIDEYAKTPIAQLFVSARYNELPSARKRVIVSETLP